jgi:hypothetical protein
LDQLWGWQAGQSCAFRGRYSENTGQGQITWFAAPSCKFTPTTVNSKPDVDGRLWGWQAGKGGKMESCAFRVSGTAVYCLAPDVVNVQYIGPTPQLFANSCAYEPNIGRFTLLQLH